MHPQLLEGLKCESKWETTEKGGVRAHSLAHSTLRLDGRVGAPGWDQDELTSFTHSHRPAQNSHKMVSAQLEHFLCQDKSQETQTHKTHHNPDLEEATTFPFTIYSVVGRKAHIQMAFCPGTSKWEFQNCLSWDSCDFGGQ